MKDEINEIKFIKYNGIEGYIELMKHDVEPLNNPECKKIELYYDGKDIKAVLDYITNLQKENERLNNIIDELEIHIKITSSGIITANEGIVGVNVTGNILNKLQKLKENKQ